MSRDNRRVFYTDDSEDAEIDQYITENYGPGVSQSQALRRIVLSTVREEQNIEDDGTVHDKLNELLAYHREDEQHTHTSEAQSVSQGVQDTDRGTDGTTNVLESAAADLEGVRLVEQEQHHEFRAHDEQVEAIANHIGNSAHTAVGDDKIKTCLLKSDAFPRITKCDRRTLKSWKQTLSVTPRVFSDPHPEYEQYTVNPIWWTMRMQRFADPETVTDELEKRDIPDEVYDSWVDVAIDRGMLPEPDDTQEVAQSVPDECETGATDSDNAEISDTQEVAQSVPQDVSGVDEELQKLEAAEMAVADGGADDD